MKRRGVLGWRHHLLELCRVGDISSQRSFFWPSLCYKVTLLFYSFSKSLMFCYHIKYYLKLKAILLIINLKTANSLIKHILNVCTELYIDVLKVEETDGSVYIFRMPKKLLFCLHRNSKKSWGKKKKPFFVEENFHFLSPSPPDLRLQKSTKLMEFCRVNFFTISIEVLRFLVKTTSCLCPQKIKVNKYY